MIYYEGDLTIRTKLHSLKIRDELQGRLSASPQYLACSVLRNGSIYSSPNVIDPYGKEMPVVLNEDDDTFTDALPDFVSLADAGGYFQNLDTSSWGTTGEISGVAGFESAEALIHEQDLALGRGISGEIFYEAEGGDSSDFVSVIFSTRSPSSHNYDGIDTQVFSLLITIYELKILHSRFVLTVSYDSL